MNHVLAKEKSEAAANSGADREKSFFELHPGSTRSKG
jgi:hypothetical protein